MLRSVDLRPQLHFHPARLAAVELLVRLDGVADRLVLGEELARIDGADRTSSMSFGR